MVKHCCDDDAAVRLSEFAISTQTALIAPIV